MPDDVATIIAGLAAKKPVKGHYIEAIAYLDPRSRPDKPPNYTLNFRLRPELGEEDVLDYGPAWDEHVTRKYAPYGEALAKQHAAGRKLTEQYAGGALGRRGFDLESYRQDWNKLQAGVARAKADRQRQAKMLGKPDLDGPAPDGCTELECLLKTAFLDLEGGRAFGARLQRGELVVGETLIIDDTLQVDLVVEFDQNESVEEAVRRTTSEAYHRNVLTLGTRAVVSVLVELMNLVPHPTKRDFTADELVLDWEAMAVKPYYGEEEVEASPGEEILPGRLVAVPICFGTDGCGESLRRRLNKQMQQAWWLAGAYGAREKPTKTAGSCLRCMRPVGPAGGA